LTFDEYFASGVFPNADSKVGHSVGNDPTLLSWRDNFTGFWQLWQDDLVKTDYKLLDEILPDRVRTVGEWMKLTGYDGTRVAVLKDYDDRRKKG